MTSSHQIIESSREGYPVRELRTRDRSLSAAFAPQLGMIGCSLEHEGVELLGQRGGLARYEAQGSTMGIPLLHPWANRLSGFQYEVAGRRVQLDRDSPLLHFDPNGLPIHGVLAASPYWHVTGEHGGEREARLTATLDYGAHPELLEAFPFPHTLTMTIILAGATLSIETNLAATGDCAVPVSFGYHPYLRLPDVPRSEWHVEVPVRRRLALDERSIPTGETEPARIEPGPLGDRHFDDGFYELEDAPFVLSGGGRRIEVRFTAGYSFAQLYAPPDQDVICFEPMTAATNALVAGGPGLTLVEPGASYVAAFEIGVFSSSFVG